MFIFFTGLLLGFYLGVIITILIRIIKVGDKDDE